MKSNNVRKKGGNKPLKWIVGLEFTAIVIGGILLVIFILKSGLFSAATKATSLPEPTTVLVIPTATIWMSPTAAIFTPEPSPTLTPTPNQLIGPAENVVPAFEFDLQTANQVIPEDILQEVAYFSGLGGGDEFCVNDQGVTGLKIVGEPERNIELMASISVDLCGVIPSEELAIKIIYPDGTERNFNQIVKTDGDFSSFDYPTALDDPLGTYTVIIAGKTGRVTFQQNVNAPTGPRLYHVDNGWTFYHFLPGEKIKVIAYERVTGDCPGPIQKCQIFVPRFSQEYSADEQGQLDINSEQKYLIGIGEFTGKVVSYAGYWYARTEPVFMGGQYCPNLPEPLNIQPGEWVLVTDKFAWIDQVEWYENLAGEYSVWDSAKKRYVPLGTVFQVGNYVTVGKCTESGKTDYRLLSIYCEPGSEYCGYIPEGSGERYFIRSISRPGNIPSCGDAPEPRLQIGRYAIAYVNPAVELKSGPFGVELKSSPYNNGMIKTVLSKGTRIKVLAGPVCNPPVQPGKGSNYRWLVETDSGFEGWVSEGTNNHGYSLQLEE
jgi:hypothetical protein